MNKIIAYVVQDWQVNCDTSSKSRLILLLFRSAQLSARLPVPFSILGDVYRLVYQFIVEWVLGVELPWNTQVGSSLKLHHGVALVVHHKATLGANCILRHSTTIGNKKLADGSYSDSPKIGNDVDIGANALILGAISIGDRAVIGAGAVVVRPVPAGAVVAGNPARIIRISSAATAEFEATNELVSARAVQTTIAESAE